MSASGNARRQDEGRRLSEDLGYPAVVRVRGNGRVIVRCAECRDDDGAAITITGDQRHHWPDIVEDWDDHYRAVHLNRTTTDVRT